MKRTDITENQETGTVKADRAIVALVCGLWLLPPVRLTRRREAFAEERRTLAQRPALSVRSVLADVYGRFEESKDQFPARFDSGHKASVRYHLLGTKTTTTLHRRRNRAKLDYPLNIVRRQPSIAPVMYDAYRGNADERTQRSSRTSTTTSAPAWTIRRWTTTGCFR